jgi:hypothetical protein
MVEQKGDAAVNGGGAEHMVIVEHQHQFLIQLRGHALDVVD